eukprot:scaffold18813_cov55-Phaeocystis_antarctica.AAC.2
MRPTAIIRTMVSRKPSLISYTETITPKRQQSTQPMASSANTAPRKLRVAPKTTKKETIDEMAITRKTSQYSSSSTTICRK